MTADPSRCACGCPPEPHEHYRAGTDCGACGQAVCPAYAPGPTPLAHGLRRGLFVLVVGGLVLGAVLLAGWPR